MLLKAVVETFFEIEPAVFQIQALQPWVFISNLVRRLEFANQS